MKCKFYQVIKKLLAHLFKQRKYFIVRYSQNNYTPSGKYYIIFGKFHNLAINYILNIYYKNC